VPPKDHEVTLLGRAGCHLCEAARAEIERICGELGTPWRELDVDADPELRSEYGDRVPVTLVDGAEHDYFEVTERRLRAALAR
jgi:Glutaredoxin-like domain (DUF836)